MKKHVRNRGGCYFICTRFLTGYKKNTCAVFLSFVLTFLLATVLLVLLHTNHKIDNIKYQTKFSAADCYVEGLKKGQVEKLQRMPGIAHMGITQNTGLYTRNLQTVYIQGGDDDYITLTAKLAEGNMPREENEIVAEEWALLNLGIEPTIGKEFDLSLMEDDKEETQTVKIVGILTDMPANKQYGILTLYTGIDPKIDDFTCYIQFQQSINYKGKVENLQKELGIRKKQIHHNPAREDQDELFRIDVQILSIIVLVCMIVFYGIYRITLITRERQYGILRAVGMEQSQLRRAVLLELYQIYCFGVPVGIAAGFLIAWFIVKISGDRDTIVYLYGQSIRFVPVVPVRQIVFLVFIVAFLVGAIGYASGKRILKKPVMELLVPSQGKSKNFSCFRLKRNSGKLRTLYSLGEKYIVKDVKTSLFAVLIVCTGIVLFTGLFYWAEVTKTYQDDIKKWQYLNGQYVMSLAHYDHPYQGVSRKALEDIAAMQGVSSIKTSAQIPIRVIDDGRKRNDDYYDHMNASVKKYQGYELAGYDGKDQVFQSNLCGYNTEALKELKKYLISGDFDAEKGLGENEIILAVLSMDNTKGEEDQIASWYEEGDSLMPYRTGEKVRIKYRADFHTEEAAYIKMQDKEKEYIYKEYTVAALVYFPYMLNVDRTNIYPMLITDDKNVQKIAGDGCCQCIYIDHERSMPPEQQKRLELALIQISAKAEGGVTTRSMASEIRQNEMFYRKQMIYVFSIALVTFILVLINLMNQIIYRMQARTREICMLRAIGMSIAMTKKIQMFENGILACIAGGLAYFLSQPVLRYLYQVSDMEVNGHPYLFDYKAFFAIFLSMLLLCLGLSKRVLKSWKTRRIMEAMGFIS